MLAGEIAASLDCTFQLVGKRARILRDRDLVERIDSKGQRWWKLTKKALDRYFTNNETDALDY